MADAIACPIDGKDDQIQKVTAVVSGGAEGLRRRLARPEVPPRPQTSPHPPLEKPPTLWGQLYNDVEAFSRLFSKGIVGPLVILGIVLVVVFGVGYVTAPVFLLIMGGNQQNANTAEFILGLAILGGIVVLVESARTRAWQRRYLQELPQHTADEQKITAKLEADARAWEENARHIQAAQELWSSSLYYCHKHDVVFLEGQPQSAPPEQMLKLLTGSDTVQQAPVAAPLPDAYQVSGATAPADDAAWEYCEIECHRSFVALNFTAQAVGPGGRYTAGSRSDIPAPSSGADIGKHSGMINELVQELLANGWEVTPPRGQYWFSWRFRRRAGQHTPGH